MTRRDWLVIVVRATGLYWLALGALAILYFPLTLLLAVPHSPLSTSATIGERLVASQTWLGLAYGILEAGAGVYLLASGRAVFWLIGKRFDPPETPEGEKT